jgi:ABC-type transport system involved in cytochrome bd biosynthesis fused ATPase/permease subunit
MGESFDHCPPGWIRQGGKRCTQFIHNRMVVDYLSMSSANFAIPDLCSLINVPSVPRQSSVHATQRLHWMRHDAASCFFKMISFSNINEQDGKQLLFVDASFQSNPGERVGLVGANRSGKTTLLRTVVGEETPDEGAVCPQEVASRSLSRANPVGAPTERG